MPMGDASRHTRVGTPDTAEIQRLRHEYLKQSAPWQERHNLEIKSQVRFVEFRYRDYPVMRKEDL